MTYTVVLLELSQAAYDEIKRRVTDAGQTDRFMRGGAIDMRDIAVCLERNYVKADYNPSAVMQPPEAVPPALGTDPDIIECPPDLTKFERAKQSLEFVEIELTNIKEIADTTSLSSQAASRWIGNILKDHIPNIKDGLKK